MVDADIYGHSVPRMLGATDRPTKVDDMIMPPQAHGVKVISIGMFTPGNDAVVWRGPMLHRALQQFLADVFWGDLDVLLLDLPPGTGDIAISTAQLVPNAELLVVTTPQQAAAEVAERAGSIALQTRQRLAGVVENMSWMELPDGTRMEVFGSGGGQTRGRLADPRRSAPRCRCSARSRWSRRLRECGDSGTPIVLADPDSAGGAGAARGRRQAHRARPRPGRDEPEHLPRPQVPTPTRSGALCAPTGSAVNPVGAAALPGSQAAGQRRGEGVLRALSGAVAGDHELGSHCGQRAVGRAISARTRDRTGAVRRQPCSGRHAGEALGVPDDVDCAGASAAG